jgi:hypothetical protein
MGAFPPTVSNMKLSNIYSILAAFIFVCFFIISNGFHDDEGENETANFINTPITKIPKLDDIDFSACNKTFGTTSTIVMDDFFEEHVTTTYYIDICRFPDETFASLCVASAMLAFAGLFYSAYVWRKCAPTDSSEPHESKTACIFIHRHKTPYDVDLYATVANLKQKIGDRIGSDVIDDQYIIFAGKRLSDNKRLLDYNIQMHSTLFLSGRLCGGMDPAQLRAGARRRYRMNGQTVANQSRANDTDNSTNTSNIPPIDEDEDEDEDEEQSHKSVEDIRFAGLKFCGYTKERQKRVKQERNEERFRALYGVSSNAITKFHRDFHQIGEEEDRIIKDKDFRLNHFFMTLHWLKAYPTYFILEAFWGVRYQDAEIVKKYTKQFQALKNKKIRWFEDGELDENDLFIISVDGVHCRTHEVRKDPSSKWYSHKSHGAGLTYELAIAIRQNRLVHIKGPYPASKNDLTIFRYGDGDKNNPQPSLKDKILAGKRVIADSSYKAEDGKTVSTTRRSDTAEVRELKARAKSRQETFNARIKGYRILATEFRHGIEHHKMVMESICILVQYDLESGHPLFQV